MCTKFFFITRLLRQSEITQNSSWDNQSLHFSVHNFLFTLIVKQFRFQNVCASGYNNCIIGFTILPYIKGYLLRHHLSTVRLIFQRNDLMKHFWNIFYKGHIRSRNQLLTLRNSKKSYKNPLSTVTLNASCIKANELLSGCTFACMEIAGSRAAQKSSSFWQFIAWFCS